MKNPRNILWITLALVIGFGLGYLIFHSSGPTHEERHDHSSQEGTTWTCSMHPQIRKSEPGKCPICGMDLIPLKKTGESSSDPMVISLSEGELAVGNVETDKVGTGSAMEQIRLNGRVVPSESRIYTQVSHVPGRIENLFITTTGAYLKKGSHIADIYSPELITAQKEFLEAARMKEKNKALYQAAKQKLRNWKIPGSIIDELERSEVVRESFPLTADVEGIILERMVNTGDHLKPGSPIFRVADLSKVWIEFDAYSDQLSGIEMGDTIVFTINGIPGKTFHRPITFIDPFVDPKTRVARVRVEVSNQDRKLLPDQFAVGTIRTGSASRDALLIPRTSIIWTGERSLVYVRIPETESPQFTLREIQIGETTGDWIRVLDGLDPGEEIVTQGVFTVDAAAQLSGKRSMMNQNEGLEQSHEGSHPLELTKDQWERSLKQYILIKNALVDDDLPEAQIKAKEWVSLKEKDPMTTMDVPEAVNDIILAANMESARNAFYDLSQVIISTAQKMGGPGRSVYIQHCPMANKNQGALWISFEEEVKNPYFGESMLTCGSVVQVIKNQTDKK